MFYNAVALALLAVQAYSGIVPNPEFEQPSQVQRPFFFAQNYPGYSPIWQPWALINQIQQQLRQHIQSQMNSYHRFPQQQWPIGSPGSLPDWNQDPIPRPQPQIGFPLPPAIQWPPFFPRPLTLPPADAPPPPVVERSPHILPRPSVPQTMEGPPASQSGEIPIISDESVHQTSVFQPEPANIPVAVTKNETIVPQSPTVDPVIISQEPVIVPQIPITKPVAVVPQEPTVISEKQAGEHVEEHKEVANASNSETVNPPKEPTVEVPFKPSLPVELPQETNKTEIASVSDTHSPVKEPTPEVVPEGATKTT